MHKMVDGSGTLPARNHRAAHGQARPVPL